MEVNSRVLWGAFVGAVSFVVAVVVLTGCNDKGTGGFRVRLYSGGEVVREWDELDSDAGVRPYPVSGDAWAFRDSSGNLVRIQGTFVIESR